ncbi:MAG TPA: hypothetical protein VFA10_29300, partial [Ktedonobacteraceae bacterium]|nr:hypothetical protein [Ktedonobacteraceae bacterium]
VDGSVRPGRRAIYVPIYENPGREEELLHLAVEQDEINRVRREVRQTMWQYVSLCRDQQGLLESRTRLNDLRNDLLAGNPRDRKGAQIVSAWRETVNMLKVAELVIAAALQRRESRGSHWRRDYDFTDPALAGCHYVFQPMGNMDKEVFSSKTASNRVTTPIVLGQQKEVMSHASCNG